MDPETCPPIIVVGNKCDLENERVVSQEQGRRLAQDFGPNAYFMETSAKADINVEEVRKLLSMFGLLIIFSVRFPGFSRGVSQN